MTNTKWHVRGEYFETCTCDYLCPCIFTNLAGAPTHGYCDFAMALRVDHGHYGDLSLDGLSMVIIAHCPGPTMADGNIGVGLILDERATPEQQNALTMIGSGQGGGPMAALGPLVTQMLGVESRPIHFAMDGLKRSVNVAGVLDEAVEGVPSAAEPGEPIYIDNTVHPVNKRLALAKATRSHLHIFGMNWDDTSGKNNGHFAPFNWEAN